MTCKSYVDVVRAIKDMVTQSAGPYTALGMGMALAAFESSNLSKIERIKFLEKADFDLKNSRITTKNRYEKITQRALKLGKEAIEKGQDPVEAIMDDNIESINRRYKTMRKVGDYLLDLIPYGGSILTQCYGETIIGALVALAKERGKNFKVYCAETRPYFQGARLTATCFAEEGFDTTILSDNMIAYAFDQGLVDIFTSAADSITEDGSVVNKVGTLQIAQLAKVYGIDYYVTGIPDKGVKTLADVEIEMKDPKEVLMANGIFHASPKAKALYPSFDKTPALLVKGIVTDRGVFEPKNLQAYFDQGPDVKFY